MQPEGSLGAISDADRFVTDVAAVNKNERDAAIARKEQIFYSKRLSNADREEKRWRTIEMEDVYTQNEEAALESREDEAKQKGRSGLASDFLRRSSGGATAEPSRRWMRSSRG